MLSISIDLSIGIFIAAILPKIIDKNVTLLAGKELIGWTIEAAKSSKYIDRVIVSTDGKKISEVASRFGAEVYVRPKHLSQDSSLVIDCLRNLISRLKREKETANYLILLEPTSPLRNTKDIDLSIGIFIAAILPKIID